MDEVYEHIIYDGRKHVYMNSIPGMWERTVSCSSLSKTYSVTGWRLGYAIAPENIMARIRRRRLPVASDGGCRRRTQHAAELL